MLLFCFVLCLFFYAGPKTLVVTSLPPELVIVYETEELFTPAAIEPKSVPVSHNYTLTFLNKVVITPT